MALVRGAHPLCRDQTASVLSARRRRRGRRGVAGAVGQFGHDLVRAGVMFREPARRAEPHVPAEVQHVATARTLKLIVSVGISGALAVTVYSPGARRATVLRMPSPSTGRHGRNRSNWPTACWARAAEANTINDWTLNGPKPDCEPNSSVLTG